MNCSFFTSSRAGRRCHVCCAPARFHEFGHVSKFNELLNGTVLYAEEGSIAETSV